MLERELTVDAAIDLSELTPKYFAVIRQLAPFGPDNMRPLFYSKGLQSVGFPRIVGKAVPHLKCSIRPSQRIDVAHLKINGQTAPNNIPLCIGGAAIDAIGFGLGDRIEDLTNGTGKLRDDIEMIYALDENDFNGKVTPQLVIKDFR